MCLNFHCKILQIEQVTLNLRRRLEKKLFYGVHHNSQQNHFKKNQSANLYDEQEEKYLNLLLSENKKLLKISYIFM